MDGAEIRRQRGRRGWRLEELAEKVGVGPKTISSWERGLSEPRGANLERLLYVFEMAPLGQSVNPLADYPDLDLIRELERRAAMRGRRHDDVTNG